MSRPKSGGGSAALVVAAAAVAAFVLLAAVIAVMAAGSADDDGETGPVEVSGALPPLPGDPGAGDPAVGEAAPTVAGYGYDGGEVAVGDGGEVAELVVFLAHWCPACQAELPELVAAAEAGDLDHVDVTVVATAVTPGRDEYPPSEWLAREGWDGTVLRDNGDSDAFAAYGLSAFPSTVLIDTDGRVAGRVDGGPFRPLLDLAGEDVAR